jgi:hypothetical protein
VGYGNPFKVQKYRDWWLGFIHIREVVRTF